MAILPDPLPTVKKNRGKRRKAGIHPRVNSGLASRQLIVEDELVVRMLLQRTLSKLGHPRCEIAENGAEAVCAFAPEKYKVIFLLMPIMKGDNAIKKIREIEGDGPRTPIIANSADCLAGERCLEAGADAFFSQPFRTTDLARCLNQVGITTLP